MKIIEINMPEATVELSGVKRHISLSLLSEEDVRIGDHVIVHAGFAIEKLDPEDARERLSYLEEMLELE